MCHRNDLPSPTRQSDEVVVLTRAKSIRSSLSSRHPTPAHPTPKLDARVGGGERGSQWSHPCFFYRGDDRISADLGNPRYGTLGEAFLRQPHHQSLSLGALSLLRHQGAITPTRATIIFLCTSLRMPIFSKVGAPTFSATYCDHRLSLPQHAKQSR